MKKQRICLILVTVMFVAFVTQSSPATSLYEDEYKFLQTVNEWMQISGYENQSFSQSYQEILRVINRTDDNITYIHIYSTGIYVEIYNFSLHELFPYLGPIGIDFINADNMSYYYDLWLNQENITEAYYTVLGVGFTTDERYADNYLFKANLSIFLENQKVDYMYDSECDEISSIFDDYTLSMQLYVEYDSSGVLLKRNEKIQVVGSIIQLERVNLKQRVDEFNILKTSSEETSFASLFYCIAALLVIIKVSKKRKSL